MRPAHSEGRRDGGKEGNRACGLVSPRNPLNPLIKYRSTLLSTLKTLKDTRPRVLFRGAETRPLNGTGPKEEEEEEPPPGQERVM